MGASALIDQVVDGANPGEALNELGAAEVGTAKRSLDSALTDLGKAMIAQRSAS